MRELHEQKCPARARPVLACFVLVLDPCSSYKAICSLVLAGRVSRCSRAILVARRPLILLYPTNDISNIATVFYHCLSSRGKNTTRHSYVNNGDVIGSLLSRRSPKISSFSSSVPTVNDQVKS